MELSKHCQLCEHRLFDISFGTKCGLTLNKPDFDRSCSNISFKDQYIKRIKEINITYDKVQRSKWLSLSNFFFFMFLSAAIITSGYLLGKLVFESGVISTVPLIIMGVGVSVLPLASGPLNKYRTELKISKKNKEDLDHILLLYGIEYTVDVKIEKDLHGNEDVFVDVVFKK